MYLNLEKEKFKKNKKRGKTNEKIIMRNSTHGSVLIFSL